MANPKLPEGISFLHIKKWRNRHHNFTQKLVENASFKVRNPSSIAGSHNKYNATTKNLQWLIAHAIKNKIRLRALGSGWSFSKVGVTEGGLIDTKSLYLNFALRDKHIDAQYRDRGKTAGDLLFAQCGTTIHRLNTQLEKHRTPKRSLKASGASNGQTIAGALSTGTHGAAFNTGAVQDQVVGLHLIVGPNRHVFLERASSPVVSTAFTNWLGAEHIRDDRLFNAALVSFGSFGFIHGVLVESEPLFLLESHRWRLPYDARLKKAMNKLDFSEMEKPFPVDGPRKKLYHFEIVVNPHCFAKNDRDKGVYVKTIYKMPYREKYPRDRRILNDGFTYGDDTLGVIQSVIDKLGGIGLNVVPALANLLFPIAYGTDIRKGPSYGTLGETFDRTSMRGKAASCALGIDIKYTSRVLEEIIKLNDKHAFPGAIGIRFVKGSEALLGFTKFETTCVLEMDGVDSKKTRKFYERVWKWLEKIRCDYTLHWGKINFGMNATRIRRMYGQERVNDWIYSRNQLLDKKSREVFTNEFMEKCNLNIEVGD